MRSDSPRPAGHDPAPVADLDFPLQSLLRAVPFAHPEAAAAVIRRLTSPSVAGEATRFGSVVLLALRDLAAPDRALLNLDRFLAGNDEPARVVRALTSDPHALQVLLAIFSGSQFLTDILLRDPRADLDLIRDNGLARLKRPDELLAEARAATEAITPAQRAPFAKSDGWQDRLRRYQRREILRIGASDLTGLLGLISVTAQLSGLADAVIQTCLEIEAARLSLPLTGFAVIGMGKLGGGELNYSSDVDLLFLADQDATRFQRVAERLIRALTEVTHEGFLYRVDMRLRPWGRVGPLVSTLTGYLAYLSRDARLWEKQALLRARMVAGDPVTGRRFLGAVQPLLFSPDEAGAEAVRADVHAMKQLTESQLLQEGREWGEVKLGAGSIRDAEFVVQYLQIVNGAARSELRTGNTLDAIARLRAAGLLPAADGRVLSEGYLFLRTVEHYLQILDYRQTHTLPSAQADLRYLAQRLGYRGQDAAARFVTRYEQHSRAIRSVYLRYLSGEPLITGNSGSPPAGGLLTGEGSPMTGENRPNGPGEAMKPAPADAAEAGGDAPQSDVVARHLARLAPSYAETFDPPTVIRHAAIAQRLSDPNPLEVEAEPLDDGHWRVTVVGYDFLGELSIICGLLFAYGFSIMDGHVFTYEPQGAPAPAGEDRRRKIIDTFTVRAVDGGSLARGPDGSPEPVTHELWNRYATDLQALVRVLQRGQTAFAQGWLAKRVGSALPGDRTDAPVLSPVDIEIDNAASDHYTLLRIEAPDTPGFLYEFTNALSLNGIHIAQVSVSSEGERVCDTLLVTDVRGNRITSPERERELRSASVLVKHFTHLLPRSPNPEAALLHFNEYLGELFARPSWPDELTSLERPEVLDALARLLGVSEFLWDDFLRMQYANLFPVVRDVDALASARSRSEMESDLSAVLEAAGTVEEWRDSLNAFKDREMFRIDMRQILGRARTLHEFGEELSSLAEVVVEAALRRSEAELTLQFGIPTDSAGNPARWAVCALGKCGGREMGFASDVELMLLFDGSGDTSGARSIGNAEFFEKLVIELTRSIRARREGVFEIDLQLRPYGKAGSLAVPLESFRRYFVPGGPAWSYERQALVKLRPFAGDPTLQGEVQALRDDFLFTGAPFDVAGMRAMRERQLRHLVTAGTINAKFGTGGLTDLEYTVQGLQLMHGHRAQELRTTNTATAIAALAANGIVSAENAARLDEALVFLQRLINALRMVRGNNRDLTVPEEGSEEFRFLSRRLGYGDEPARLASAINEHVTWVQVLEQRLLG